MDEIRFLRCKRCGSEFGERKGTALWNMKVLEAKAVSVAEHLSEGCSQESTARLADVDISMVQRLNKAVGKHGRLFHEERVTDIEVEALQADERHGFSETKGQAAWEAEVMDPKGKLILAYEQGRRDEQLRICQIEILLAKSIHAQNQFQRGNIPALEKHRDGVYRTSPTESMKGISSRHEFEAYHNSSRPHQGIGQGIPMMPDSQSLNKGPVRCRNVLHFG